MLKTAIKGQRLIALFLLGSLLFNYPLLDLFNRAAEVFQVPLLYAYIFGAWAALIALMALVVEPDNGRQSGKMPREEE